MNEPADLERMISKLVFHEEDVARAAMEQPKLFLEACRFRVQKLRKKIAAKTDYEQKYARVAMQLRAQKRKGQTEGLIKDRAALHSSVREAKKAFDKAAVAEEWSELLVEAYRQRKDACKILAQILGSEASAELRIAESDLGKRQMQRMRDKVRQRFPGREVDY